jgi:hypothetical protein
MTFVTLALGAVMLIGGSLTALPAQAGLSLRLQQEGTMSAERRMEYSMSRF